MDGEDVRQLLKEARLRCLLLEADRDAEIFRAMMYRKALDDLVAGEDGSNQPRVASISHMPRRPLVCPLVSTSVVA